MTPKERAGVLEVLLGVGLGGGEARKRFVEQGNDSLCSGSGGSAIARLRSRGESLEVLEL